MTVLSTSDNTDAQRQRTDIQLTLSVPEAERLRIALPWLVRALADKPNSPPRLQERREHARTALESLLAALTHQLQEAEGAVANH